MERSKLTKAHIISHILVLRGPSTRDELLRECARIEGKEYKPTSNGSYFRTFEGPSSPYLGPADYDRLRRPSLVTSGVIKVVGRRGRAPVYGLDERGFGLAAECAGCLERHKSPVARAK